MASGSKNNIYLLLGIGVALIVGFLVGRLSKKNIENFASGSCNVCQQPRPCGCPAIIQASRDSEQCGRCNKPRPCGCPKAAKMTETVAKGLLSVMEKEHSLGRAMCPPCEKPDMSKWIRKSSVPPCPPVPDMSRYMLKTECPPQPDMSKYVLKSSVPKCPPCISTCSKPCKIGACPPCPRARCPTVQCPEPKACPACPAAMCAPCPEPTIKCNANYEPKGPVRPMLASTSTFGF